MNKILLNLLESDHLRKLQGTDGRVCIVILAFVILVAALTIKMEFGNLKPKNWFKFFF
jgi:hypothetical protein